MKKIITIAIAGILIFAASACQKETSPQQTHRHDKQAIKIFYSDWASSTAMTLLAKVALEDKGYIVKIAVEDLSIIYESLSQGDSDILLECWLPYTSAAYWNKYQDKLEKLSVGYDGGSTGIVVPAYAEENSIEDLIAAKDKYDGMIFGIGNDSGIHGHTEKVIKAYNLPFVQVTSSDIVMTASLEDAIKHKKTIAVTGWQPHDMWSRFKVKYLKDPQKIYPQDKSYILARKGFSAENPELGKFLKNFFIANKELYSLMNAIGNADDDLAATKKWYQENKSYFDKMW